MGNTFRRGYFWVLLGLMALYVGYDLARPPWADGPMWDAYRQIHLGMTAEGEMSFFDGWGVPLSGVPYDVTGDRRQIGEDLLEVEFDARHCVSRKWARIQGHELSDPPDPRETWWDRFRAWLAGD